jgi:hypothetical protein
VHAYYPILVRRCGPGDLNGDTHLDIVAVNYMFPSATVLLGDGGFTQAGTCAGSGSLNVPRTSMAIRDSTR